MYMINDKICNSNSQEILYMLPELREVAENVVQDLLPLKSKNYYKAAYEKFEEWNKKQKGNYIGKLHSRLD